MSEGRKKPVTLEWRGSLLASDAGGGAETVTVNGTRAAAATGPASAGKSAGGNTTRSQGAHAGEWKGKLRVRREVKGRGGHPAFILYEFSPGASASQLKELSSFLRSGLGCGGSAEDGQVIIIAPSWERLKQALEKRGIAATPSGGF